MPRETNAAKRERAIEVCERLNRRYGPVECFLDHENPFKLLIAVLLSAQTTDAQVNKVTPKLFSQWPTPEAMAGASVADVADTINSLGFYKSKAKHAVEAAQMIVADYGGEVPADMKELVKLPGVGRKTANIVLNVGFGIVEGIAVDTLGTNDRCAGQQGDAEAVFPVAHARGHGGGERCRCGRYHQVARLL